MTEQAPGEFHILDQAATKPDTACSAPPDCNGGCTTARDLGADEYGDMVAYAHPDCPQHA
ncbi:hypothetical protein ACWCSD_34475 [Nonomuraea sp. NPDC001684]